MPRLLLLLPTSTYRAEDFLAAARRLGVEVVVASEQASTFEGEYPDRLLTLEFANPEKAARAVEAYARERPFDAVVGVEDASAVAGARIAAALGVPGNAPDAVAATRNKAAFRRTLSRAGLRSPTYRCLTVRDDPAGAARDVTYPCVLKPTILAASRGVIRADSAAEFVAAFRRIAAMLAAPEIAAQGAGADEILVETFIPGREVALEGLLVQGRLHVLALFDKPDPLDGPFFEETIYVTPSRLPAAIQAAVAAEASAAARALGLREGPVHAELRVNGAGPWIVEVAARSIGGLCSRALRFGTGLSLEEIILRHALRLDLASLERERRPAGVMMLPIPRRGILRGVEGHAAAEAIPGIEAVTISAHLGQELVPLPEGGRYLGFVFARADTAEAAEAALREAHRRLGFDIAAAGE